MARLSAVSAQAGKEKVTRVIDGDLPAALRNGAGRYL